MSNSKNDKSDALDKQNLEIKVLKEQLQEAVQKINFKEAQLQNYQREIAALNHRVESVINHVAKELEYARALHRALMPTEKPQIPGFEFSSKFVYGSKSGGDYFDLFEMKSKLKFGVLLISCPSFTLSSLVISIVMKITAHQHKLEDTSAAEFVKKLRAEILEQSPMAESFDILFCIVDRRDYSADIASYGETCVFLQRAEKEALEVFDSKSFAAKDKTNLAINKYYLSSRDRIIFCTKGLLQEMQPECIDRMVQAIKSAPKRGVHDLRNEILIQREKYSQKTQPEHDVTLVVIEVKERVIKLAKS